MGENYQKMLERVVAGLEGRPRLLLHACCAPCAVRALEVLRPAFEIDVLYYNPNIQPYEEYLRRYESLAGLLAAPDFADAARLLEAPYRGEDFTPVSAGYEGEPEGGARCARCFALRLRETGERARAGGYDYFTTTLTVGPRKSAAAVNAAGFGIAEEVGVKWLPADFKKGDGYRRSVELSGQYGLYRQNYCGCNFSRTRM